MSNDKETDIHREPRFLTPDQVVGHGGSDRTIRKRDGWFGKGEELGSIDKYDRVRGKDGLFRGEVVGQLKDRSAHSVDGMFPGEEWGYVDKNGVVRVKTGFMQVDREIGEVRNGNVGAALAYFVLQFQQLEKQYDQLRSDIRAASDKTQYLGKVRHMLDYVPKARALGDYDGLIHRLKQLESEVLDVVRQNYNEKCKVIDLVQHYAGSSEWKTAKEQIDQLHEKWKTIGRVEKADADELWRRFQEATQKFYSRRKEHFDRQERERQQNLSKKQEIVASAQRLSTSSDWKATGEEYHRLLEHWKTIGPVPKDQADELWNRFQAAQDQFRNRRQAYFDAVNREEQSNLQAKRQLISRAQQLTHSTDHRGAKQEVKELQSEWKTIGHVPRSESDTIWNQFREACDTIYENANAAHEQQQEEWRSRQREARDRKSEQLERLEESIAHDEENISRWESTIDNLNPGGRADEIRDSLESKISDVRDKIRSKEDKCSELRSAIRDIESRL